MQTKHARFEAPCALPPKIIGASVFRAIWMGRNSVSMNLSSKPSAIRVKAPAEGPWGVYDIRGTFLGSLFYGDPSTWGSIIGVPIFVNPPMSTGQVQDHLVPGC